MAASNKNEFDAIVIGGGVIGAFHAWFALRRGLRTLLIERNQMPRDASVRNFGTLVPSAMTAGDWHRRGSESLLAYRALSSETGFPLNTNGSLYLALTPAECAVQEEFGRIGPAQGYKCELLEARDALKINPAIDAEQVRTALYFPDDLRIESRHFFEFFLPWMVQNLGLEYQAGTTAIKVEAAGEACRVHTSDARTFEGRHVFVCSGADFRTLYPEIFAASGLRKCMLQMYRTEPMPAILPCTVASGLSMRWYSSFQICESWKRLMQEPLDAEVDRRGIHILLVQDADGGVIVGDSHAYTTGEFDERYDSVTERLIEREAQRLVRFPHWKIAQCWLGIYPLHPDRALFEQTIAGRIHIVTGSAGKGMTCAPALARESLDAAFGAQGVSA